MIKANLERCQPWRVKKAQCRLCLEACPVDGCISFEENILSIKKDLCNGCGLCISACPTGAFSVDGLDEAALIERVLSAAKGKKILFACSLGPPGKSETGVEEGFEALRLNCLGVANESVLSALALAGKELALDIDRCGGCAFKKGKQTIEGSIHSAENLLSAMGIEGRIEAVSGAAGSVKAGKKKFKEISPGPVCSRRELFSLTRALNRFEAGSGEIKAPATEGGAKLPARRKALLEALEKAASPTESKYLADGDFPVRSVSIGEGCTLCRRCEAFCPTGALKRFEAGAEARIEFDMKRCMSCFECGSLCPNGALGYEDTISLKDFTGEAAVLARKNSVECPRCSRRYLPEFEKDCPSCRKKERIDKRIESMLFSNANNERSTEGI